MGGSIVERYNQALNINPPRGDQFLTLNGSNWMWAVMGLYSFCFIVIILLSVKPKNGEKIFHYIFSVALLVGGITYFSNAGDLGNSLIVQANSPGNGTTRQIFFTKYINWVVAFPSVIIALGLLSNSPAATIVWQVFLSWTWVIAYLVSAYTPTVYKWGFFGFGTMAYLVLAGSILVDARDGCRRVGTTRDYYAIAGWINLLWLLYPIAYGLSDGGNFIGVTPHFIFFGILDVCMIPVSSFLFIGLATNWDYSKLNLYFTQYGRVARGETYPEKTTAPPAAPVVGESTT